MSNKHYCNQKEKTRSNEDDSHCFLGKKRNKEEKKPSKSFTISRNQADSDDDVFNTHESTTVPNDTSQHHFQQSKPKINEQLRADSKEIEEDIQTNIQPQKTNAKKHKSLFDQDIIAFPSVIEINTKKSDKKPIKSSINNKDQKQMQNTQLNLNDFFPWITPLSKIHQFHGMIKLHYEILDFYEFIKPTLEETAQRETIYQYIKTQILQIWPEWKAKKFGSYPTQLNLPDSDIDIVLFPNKKVKDIEKLLKKISDALIAENKFSYIEIIKARVPIIKATFKETGINVDISVDRKNGYAAKEIIKRILIEYPYMRPLLFLLKYFLRQKNLNSSFTGGISSFVLFNLLYSYILYLKKNTNERLSSEMTLGHILVGFFQFYGFEFNYEKVGLSIRYGGFFYKREDRETGGKGRNILSLENFQDLDQDLGKNCFKFIKVIDAFKIARDALYYPSIYPIKSFLGLFLFVDELMKERYEKINKK